MIGREQLLDNASKLCNQLLKEGFDEAAILLTNTNRTMIKITNSQPSITQYWNIIGLNIYLSKNKRIFTLSFEPRSLEDVIEKTLSILKYADKVSESPMYAPLPEVGSVTPLKDLVDKKVVEAMEEPSKVAENAIEVCHREKIDHVSGMIDLTYLEKVLVTSRGAELYEDSTVFQGYLRAFAGEDGSGQWSFTSRKYSLNKLEKAALTASQYAVDSRNRQAVEAGIYDIVISPMVVGNLVNIIGFMSSGFTIFIGMSLFMKNKPGEQVASTKFTLIDDPLNKELPGSTGFDDEGVPTYIKPIIEKGVFKTILHNNKTGKMMNTRSTGNAGWIMPRPWNLVVEAGDYSLDELIESVNKGLLITNNWYTRMQNYVEGLFSTVTRDAIFLIKNGRIEKPVTNLRISDNLRNILRNVDALGKDVYDIQWWEVSIPTRSPYILIRNVHTTKHLV